MDQDDRDLLAEVEALGEDAMRRMAYRRLRALPAMSTGPRDFRRGNRWLPWHSRPKGDGACDPTGGPCRPGGSGS